MVYGLDKEKFNYLVFNTLNRNRLSYRAGGDLLGISFCTFTRIKQEKDISLDSFIILLSWIKENSNFKWDELIPKIILKSYESPSIF